MFSKLDDVEGRFVDIERQLSDPEVVSKPSEFNRLAKERRDLENLVRLYRTYKRVDREIGENKALLADNDFRELAKEELSRLEPEREVLGEQLKLELLPKDPRDEKSIILEIRGGAGGDEASLFAGELFKLYDAYARAKGLKVTVESFSQGVKGGFKEITASIDGHGAYSLLKYESGVHRVQRVPATETQGRVHTSTVTVAVMVEVEDVEIDIDEKDLRTDTYRAGGAGGQHVNKTDSAVRITHIPTGVVAASQSERSQHQNRAKAMKMLRAKLYEAQLEKQTREHADERRSQVGSGDRSEKIRTYNFPQDRLTDHRIGESFHNLPKIMQGEVEPLMSAIRTHFQAEALRAQVTGEV